MAEASYSGLIAPDNMASLPPQATRVTSPIWWGDRYYPQIGATGTAVGTGAANTQKIIAVQGRTYNYAALVCANYSGGGYSDWFLPSKDELFLLYQQKNRGWRFYQGRLLELV